MNFVEYVVISLNQLESRGRTSIKKIINLYIIASQNNKACVCFLYKQEPKNIKSQLPVFITDEHDLKEIKVLLCTNTMGSSSHNKTLSCNAVTKGFSCSTSHSSARLDGQQRSFLFSWDLRWLPCDKGL